MDQCQNCKHDQKVHSPQGCSCGCAVFQPPNAPIVFNSITASEEIIQRMENLRRLRQAKDKLSE
jgi:hypothetical protein